MLVPMKNCLISSLVTLIDDVLHGGPVSKSTR
jgi:hypothetical protein